jgi:hypothetical protein
MPKEASPQSSDQQQPERSYAEWLKAVRELLQPSAAPRIHGRYLLLGLALLDRRVYAHLTESGIFDGLIAEIDARLSGTISADLLTDRGRQLWQRLGLRDSTETLSDDPADIDVLERRAFAEAVAIRLRSMRAGEPSRTLLVHLHGAWGSGKTTVLRLLEAQLEDPDAELQDYAIPIDRWIVAHFNAWQYQRSGPPWWSLVRAVSWQLIAKTLRQNPRRVPLLLWERGWFWLRSGRQAVLLGILILAIVLLVAYVVWHPTDVFGQWRAIATLASTIVTIGGVAFAISRFFAGSSSEAAERFMGSRADPMRALEEHLRRLIRHTGSPVAIFIDDLDRCEAQFVVQLLEGIQTVFRRAPVSIVVAADRRWLHHAFELVYEKFATLGGPGKPLGILFLEKTFQLTISVPGMMSKQQAHFWSWLLRMGEAPTVEAAPEQARQAARDAASEEELLNEVGRLARPDVSPAYRRAFQQEAVRRLSAPDLTRQAERHTLRDFARLLEPNPRAMKRLVNAYGMLRAIDILSERATQPQLLGLWAVLSLRWPTLASWLEEHPDDADCLRRATPPSPGCPQAILALLQDPEVHRVARGEGIPAVGNGLDRATLRNILGAGEWRAASRDG